MSRLDRKVNDAYRQVLEKFPEDGRPEITAGHTKWLEERNRACIAPGANTMRCLKEHYEERFEELRSLHAFKSFNDPADEHLKVLRISPSGDDVPANLQVVFQFDRPVVPVGRMDRNDDEIPVLISPALECEWRWLNSTALACQLTEGEMKQATSYNVVMKPGIITETGVGLAQEARHSFTTTRPKVTHTRFTNWLTPGTPLIQVTFNQPVTRSSVERSLTVDFGRETAKILAYPDDVPRQLPWWAMPDDTDTQSHVDDGLTRTGADEARRVWLVEPERELPINSQASLLVSPGLRSSEGIQAGVESRVVVSFDTFPEFEFIGIRCTLKGQSEATLISLARLKKHGRGRTPSKRCTPGGQVAFEFSAPVLTSVAKEHVVFTPGLDGGHKGYDPRQGFHDDTALTYPHESGRSYFLRLPGALQPYQKYSVKLEAPGLTDEFGRKLKMPVEFDFYTSHREPGLNLVYNAAVLEKEVASDIPLHVTNLDEITIRYDRLGETAGDTGLEKIIDVPEAQDITYALPMGLRELISDDTGVIFGSLQPEPAPPGWNLRFYPASIFAQVTPFQVHFKLGHFNSLVWITYFSNGEPVPAARVSLFTGNYENLAGLVPMNVTATTNGDGIATLPGLAEIDPALKHVNSGYRKDRPGLFVKVEYENDLAVLPLNHTFLAGQGAIYSRLLRKGGHTHAWGTTAQGLYRLGDKVDFKIYVREQSNKHWVAPGQKSYGLTVTDPQGKTVFQQPEIELNEFGAFDGNFNVPEQGATGWYRFTIKATASRDDPAGFTWEPMSILVSDFTPAPFNVSTELNGDVFRPNDQVETTSTATLHSGGAFTRAEVRLTARLNSKQFQPNNPIADGFVFGSNSDREIQNSQKNLLDVRGSLDDRGLYENEFILPDAGIYSGTLTVETAVKDDRGKFIASSVTADYSGRDYFIGLRNTRWVYEKGKPARIDTFVVDEKGAPVAGIDISIAMNHGKYKVSRVKGPGNAYLTQNILEWEQESTCNITSMEEVTSCEFVPQHPGSYQYVAVIEDKQGREHKTTINSWVTGHGNVVWDQSNDATLQIIPGQTEYRVGETARYLIKNPFPGANALVSVERYGILDSWTQVLETNTPVIEVPVKPDYLPGFYLSVVVTSPRVEQPLGPNKVDLGKPTYRIGYVTANIIDPHKQVTVSVETDSEVYQPRELVKARIHAGHLVETGNDSYEIAVAVVDEAVLAMNTKGRLYYDPYAGFNRLDRLDVVNYSLLSRLVGKQKFEKKGANQGGDGGRIQAGVSMLVNAINHPANQGGGGGRIQADLRNLFEFVSYWNPSIIPDAQGYAQIEFEVPDNLTGWRIFALAVNQDDRMGLGETGFKVNRPTEIRPVMPNQVVDGDEFKAGFSIINRTHQERQLGASVEVKGALAEQVKTRFNFELVVAPFERRNIWLPLRVQGAGELIFLAEAGDQVDTDALSHSLTVNKRLSLERAASYGSIVNDTASETIHIPDGINPEAGGFGAVLSPTIIGNIDGAFNYVKDYPHKCWEQLLGKAVIAASYLRLEQYAGKTVEWSTAAEDISKTMEIAENFQAPNGGMVYWKPSNQYVSPYLSAYTALAFNWLRDAGHELPELVETRLHEYLLRLLKKDEFPAFYNDGMSSSVRAVALAALSETGKINASDVVRYQRHFMEMDLFGKSHFLQAAVTTPGVRQRTIDRAVNHILSHASQSRGKFQFNEVWDDSYKYLLATPLRSNCAVLTALLRAGENVARVDKIADIPSRLVRSISQGRGNRDHWENTQENVFCLNALTGYAGVYETEEPDMHVSVSADSRLLGSTRFTARKDPTIQFSRSYLDNEPGKLVDLEIRSQGTGRLYYSAQVSYSLAENIEKRTRSGIEVRREYSVVRDGQLVKLQSPMKISRGELVKIDLFISIPTARHFVAVLDPIPGGLEPVNTDLATSSMVDVERGNLEPAQGSWFYNFSSWTRFGRYSGNFYHRELRHDSARFYADYLPAGNYHLSYTAQAIAVGRFTVMPVHAEEMYDPDVYGKGLSKVLRVTE